MALVFPGEWRFGEAPDDTMPSAAISEFITLVGKISAAAENRQGVVEIFKHQFALALGSSASRSSDHGWAMTDLRALMDDAADNVPVFLDALWGGISKVSDAGIPVPKAVAINRILGNNGVPYEIRPPNLVRRDHVVVVSDAPSTSKSSPGWHYTTEDQIGAGGYGVVYRVTRETGVGPMEFALKLLDPSPFTADPDRAKDRFQREITAIRGMQHRGIVTYLDAGFDAQGRPFLVMPLITGLRYTDFTARLTMPDRALLMVEVLGAVGHAHQCGVLHRDLKPSNVLVRESDGQPIIVDFGQAYLLDHATEHSLTTTLIGSLGYVPSEVQANPKANRTPLHDVFSCGVMLYESIVGSRPDPTSVPSLTAVHPALAPLDPVVRRALATANERYPDAASFATELAAAVPVVRAGF